VLKEVFLCETAVAILKRALEAICQNKLIKKSFAKKIALKGFRGEIKLTNIFGSFCIVAQCFCFTPAQIYLWKKFI